MATYAALGHTTYIGGYDLTSDSAELKLELSREPLIDTPFGSTAQRRKAGLQSVSAEVSGCVDFASGGVDSTLFSTLGSTLQVVTHTPTATELDVAYMYQAKNFEYQVFGQVGEMDPYNLKIEGARGNGTLSAGAVRGRMLKAKGNISGTGVTGQVFQIGAVSATQYLYAAVHCFSIGTSFTLQIQSDNASNFPSATTQMTIGSITAVGSTWGTRAAGPITDDFWRVNVSAVTGTSSIAVVVGIK